VAGQLTIVKATDERGWRARADRRIQRGRVISVDKITHTCVLDTGEINNLGVKVYLTDVPYQPQNPPQLNDFATVLYTNSSPHSYTVGGMGAGGANTGGSTPSGGGKAAPLIETSSTELLQAAFSSLFGQYSSIGARLDAIELALLSCDCFPPGFYWSLDFSQPRNSFYLLDF